jgi:hypothetical protein
LLAFVVIDICRRLLSSYECSVRNRMNARTLELAVASVVSATRPVLFHYSLTASDTRASAASVRRRNRSGSLGDA